MPKQHPPTPHTTTPARTMAQLNDALSELTSPRDAGRLDLIVVRPSPGERRVLTTARLTTKAGLEGDGWLARGSSRTDDGAAHPGMQLTLMNSRVIALLAGSRERWPLAGDQLYVDLDLSEANLPPGTELKLGEAVIAITDVRHTGCKKFVERFGADAMKWVNSARGKALNLRGVNARVVVGGAIASGDMVRKRIQP